MPAPLISTTQSHSEDTTMNAAEIKAQLEQLQAKLDEMYPDAVIRAAEHIKHGAGEVDVTVEQFWKDVGEELFPSKRRRKAPVMFFKRDPQIAYRGGKMPNSLVAVMKADGVDPSDSEAAALWRAENLVPAAWPS